VAKGAAVTAGPNGTYPLTWPTPTAGAAAISPQATQAPAIVVFTTRRHRWQNVSFSLTTPFSHREDCLPCRRAAPRRAVGERDDVGEGELKAFAEMPRDHGTEAILSTSLSFENHIIESCENRGAFLKTLSQF
jgi:hypothetical protein